MDGALGWRARLYDFLFSLLIGKVILSPWYMTCTHELSHNPSWEASYLNLRWNGMRLYLKEHLILTWNLILGLLTNEWANIGCKNVYLDKVGDLWFWEIWIFVCFDFMMTWMLAYFWDVYSVLEYKACYFVNLRKNSCKLCVLRVEWCRFMC